MMTSETNEHIATLAKKLKIPTFEDYAQNISHNMSFEENLRYLLEIEAESKDRKGIERRTKGAGFPLIHTLDSFDNVGDALPNLKHSQIMELSNCKFIREKRNVIAIGNSGTGKTHAMIGIGIEAIRRGFTVKFRRASDLVNQMSEAQDEKQLTRYIKNLNSCQLLLVDQLGYLAFDLKGASLLFQIFAARYEISSTIVTSNLEFSKWISFLGNDKAMSAALVDRLIHKAEILNMNGKSYRLKNAKEEA